MYTYIRGHGLLNDLSSPVYQPLDVTLSMNDLTRTYREMVVELTVIATGATIVVDFSEGLRLLGYSYNSENMTDILLLIGNSTLPIIPTEYPSLTLSKVKYRNYTELGYKLTLGKAGLSVPDNYPKSELPDVLVHTGDVSAHTSDATRLISVNGFIHKTTVYDDKLYINNAVRTATRSKMNNVGILDFTDFSTFTKVNFIEDDILHIDDTLPVNNRVSLTTSTDLTGKGWFMVIGGYLVFPKNNQVWSTNGNTITIDLESIFYKDKILESSVFIDIPEMEHLDDLVVDLSVVEQLSWIKKWLSGNHTFLVIFDDAPVYGIRTYSIKKTPIPGQFISYFRLDLPLLTAYGRLCEYLTREDNGQYSIRTVDNYKRPRLIKTVNDESMLISTVERKYANELSPGTVLEIYK